VQATDGFYEAAEGKSYTTNLAVSSEEAAANVLVGSIFAVLSAFGLARKAPQIFSKMISSAPAKASKPLWMAVSRTLLGKNAAQWLERKAVSEEHRETERKDRGAFVNVAVKKGIDIVAEKAGMGREHDLFR